MRRFTPLALLALVAACSGSESSDDAGFVHAEPTPYTPSVSTTEDASLDGDAAGARMPGALATAMALDPPAIRALYETLLARGDADCPGATATDDGAGTTGVVWESEGCTSADGTFFRGNVVFTAFDQSSSAGTRVGFRLQTQGATMEITAADGTSLRGATYMESAISTQGEQTYFENYYAGDLYSDATSAGDNPWLGGLVRGTVSIYAGDIAQGRYINFGGGFSIGGAIDGLDGVTAVAMDELTVGSFGCDATTGTASLRDAQGVWHDGFFADPEVDEENFLAVCNACGDLMVHGETIDEFCAEPAAIAAFAQWDTTLW